VKKQAILILIVLFSFSFARNGFSDTLEITDNNELNNSKTDSVKDQVHFKILKVNPSQIFFSEIPVSFEIFQKKNSSVQFQLGYIFPLYHEFPPRILFENSGKNGDAKSDGLLSYRTSPFNNYGFSIKLEFRGYGRFLYYAPQLMYKYCFYREAKFPLYNGSITIDQTESKFSSIIGFGFMMGRQSCYGNFVVDRYMGVGLRVRYMSVTILKIEDYPRPVKYPNTKESFESVYPFINMGIRLGIRWNKLF
jgi:hypothetical protein